jgi:hypothetical protein
MNDQELNEMKMMMGEDKEIWADIEGYEGYEISTHGRIRSYWKHTPGCGMKIIPSVVRYLSLSIDKYGYQNTRIYQDKKAINFRVSRLVCLHFIPNPQNLPVVDHIDGNRQNNHISNLRWATIKQNNHNRKKAINNTTGHTGVVFQPARWVANWQENNQTKSKSFQTKEEAVAHRKAMVEKHYDADFYKET